MPEEGPDWSDIFEKAGVFMTCISALAGVSVFRKSSKGLKAIIFLICISACVDLCILNFKTPSFAVPVTRIYSFFEFELTSLFFLFLAQRKYFTKVITSLMFLFPLVVVADFKLSGNGISFDNLVMVCESIVFVIYTVMAFYHFMTDMKFTSLTSTPNFWILSAILIYFGGAIFVFGSVNYASRISIDLFESLWMMHAALRITYSVILTIAFWKARKQYQ